MLSVYVWKIWFNGVGDGVGDGVGVGVVRFEISTRSACLVMLEAFHLYFPKLS